KHVKSLLRSTLHIYPSEVFPTSCAETTSHFARPRKIAIAPIAILGAKSSGLPPPDHLESKAATPPVASLEIAGASAETRSHLSLPARYHQSAPSHARRRCARGHHLRGDQSANGKNNATDRVRDNAR